MVLSWIVGIPVAIVSALRPNSLGDNVARFLSILFLAVPGFWVGMLIVLGLLFWFGYRAPLANVSLFVDPVGELADRHRPGHRAGSGAGGLHRAHGALQPAGGGSRGLCAHRSRQGIERTAGDRLHALPNALLPVITLSGILLGFVLAGSIPVERAFGTPGLGFAMYTAVSERDVFVMQNLVFLYAVVFVLLNIVVDLTIAWLDPRIRYQ